ncbi:MAG: PEP-CTERM sorting domain-containing protein [Planctomycetota bacterium]|nr:MAG: PEP-CTERM sorting domain-containing protein [Planctomycetota bacterium]
MSRSTMRTLCSITAVLGLSVLTASAQPMLQMTLWSDAPGDTPQMWNPSGSQVGPDTWQYQGSMTDPDAHWTIDWDYLVDPDPFIAANFTLVNTFSSTLTFNLVSTLPVAFPLPAPTLMGGSTGGSITDANFDGIGTAATAAPDAFYRGLIDGAAVLPIYPDPSSWSVPFAGGTATIPAVNAGLPGPTLPGPAVLSDIGIHHTFTLTPGDSIAVTSFFVVVPEPSSLLLLAIGGVFAARRR